MALKRKMTMRVSLGKPTAKPVVKPAVQTNKRKAELQCDDDDLDFLEGDPNATSILECIGAEATAIPHKPKRVADAATTNKQHRNEPAAAAPVTVVAFPPPIAIPPPQQKRDVPDASPLFALPNMFMQNATFPDMLLAFDKFLLQTHAVCDKDVASNVPRPCVAPNEQTFRQQKQSAICFRSVLLTTTRTRLQTTDRAEFCFESVCDQAISEICKHAPTAVQRQLKSLVMDQILSKDAPLLAFYTWSLRKIADIGEEDAARLRVNVVLDESNETRNFAAYLIEHGAERDRKHEARGKSFVWEDDPHKIYDMWKHLHDKHAVLATQHGAKLATVLDPRIGWLKTPTSAQPIIVIGRKQRRIATWFIKQGVNLFNYAQCFERVAQRLLMQFSPPDNVAADGYFSFDSVARLAKLLRRRLAERKLVVDQHHGHVTITRFSSLLKLWTEQHTHESKKERCRASVIFGADTMFDAEDIAAMQSQGARVVAWRQNFGDCSVNIDHVVQHEYELHAIFRNHFASSS